MIAFGLSPALERFTMPITVLDAIGLRVFAVLASYKALGLGFGVVQAILVGTITAVGGGSIRDMSIGQVPTVFRSYQNVAATLGAAAVCFVIRMVGVRFDLNAPHPPWQRSE